MNIRNTLLICTILLCNSLQAQKKESGFNHIINQRFSRTPLVQVLKSLRKETGLEFIYDHKLARSIIIDQEFQSKSVDLVLKSISRESGLTFETREGVVILKPKEESSLRKISVKGRIVDAETGETLPYCNIYIKSTNLGTSSNVDGFFSLLDVADTATIIAQYLGYHPRELRLSASSEEVEIEMVNDTELLEEVVVEEDESKTIHIPELASKFSINPSRMANLPNLGERDVIRALQYLPGISGTDETSASLNIRGSSPGQNLILYDGFSLYHIDHFFGVFSALNPAVVKNVQVFKGGYDARFGGRTSSVVEITSKNGNVNKPSFNLGLNLLSTSLLAEVPIGSKTSFLIAGRRSYTDVVESGVYRDIISRVTLNNNQVVLGFEDTFETDPTFRFYDLNTKLTFRPSEQDVLSVSHYTGNDKLNLQNFEEFGEGELLYEESVSWGNEAFSLRWARQWSDQYYSQFSVAKSNFNSSAEFLQNFEYDSMGIVFNVTEVGAQQNSISDFSVRFDNELDIDAGNTFKFGSAFTSNALRLVTSFNSIDYDDEDKTASQFALYAQNTSAIGRWNFSYGLRANYYDLNDQFFLEPRLSLMHQVNSNLRLKAAWGINNQFVQRVIRDEVYSNNPDFWLLSDDGDFIPHSSSSQYAMGFTYETEHFLLDVEGYKNKTQGVLEYFSPFEVVETSEPFSFYFEGNNYSKGIDFLLQKKSGKYNGWLAYSLNKSENDIPGLNEDDRFPSKQDQRHEFKIINMISAGSWNFGATWVYGSGRPFSAPEDLGQEILDDDFVVDNVNSERLPSYHRMDVSANYSFKLGGVSGDLGLSLSNVYNRENIKSKRFFRIDLDPVTFQDLDEPRYLSSDVKLLGFTPNFSLRLSF